MQVKTKLNKSFICVFFAGVISFLLFSCSRRPPEVLSEKEMVSLMADMQIAEGYSNITYSGRNSMEEKKELGKGILASHNITQEELDSTLAWYGKNLDEYSALFEKVDVEINRRKEALNRKQGIVSLAESASNNIWPFPQHGVALENGNTPGWIISFESPGLEKGDKLNWSMYLPGATDVKGLLGVEYDDGTIEIFSSTFTSNHKVELPLQTDTAKTVIRIFGNVGVKDNKDLPLFADSITMNVIPYDSLEYQRRRGQKKYGALKSSHIKPHIINKNDSLSLSDGVTR